MKKSYALSENKKAAQDITLKSENKRIIGLGGPDILEYVNMLKVKGYTDITIYEKDPEVYLQQVLKRPECRHIYGDILDNLNEDAFYDLDLCSSIKKIESRLPKILELEEFSLTVSLRPLGLYPTIEIFKRYGDSSYLEYRDSSSMIVFFNNKTIKNEKECSFLQ